LKVFRNNIGETCSNNEEGYHQVVSQTEKEFV
jgi:hypothetical protein